MLTDAWVDEMCRKLRIGFGVKNADDLIDQMVTRFLLWKLPKGFAPDAGITFVPPQNPNWWPTGTNLLDAAQAREMIRHMLGDV